MNPHEIMLSELLKAGSSLGIAIVRKKAQRDLAEKISETRRIYPFGFLFQMNE
ncbi:MAG: hypothetical protein ACJ72V_17470 [Nitrososphaeraceae archaeon]